MTTNIISFYIEVYDFMCNHFCNWSILPPTSYRKQDSRKVRAVWSWTNGGDWWDSGGSDICCVWIFRNRARQVLCNLNKKKKGGGRSYQSVTELNHMGYHICLTGFGLRSQFVTEFHMSIPQNVNL